MGKKKKNKIKKDFKLQENIALNNLLQFLNISSEQDNMAEVTYFTCLKVLAEGIAKLPLSLQQVTEDGGIQELRDNKIWQTVRVRPNPYMSPTDFWTIVENCRNHWGNGYVLIDRSHDGIKLWTLNPECMRIYLGNLQELQSVPDVYYIYNDPDSGQEHIYPSEDILHFKSSAIFGGLVGMSVQEKLRMSLHGAYSSQKMLNELYDNGFVPKAVVQFGGNAEANTELQKKYLKMMQDYVDGKMEGTKSFLPVSYGTNIQPLNIKLTDGQFLELRQYTALQIASAFGIKPNHLNDYTKSSYANSETQQLAFYTDTMLYIIKQYEEELNFKLLSAQQRADGCRFKFNIAAVLRGDTKSQVESLTQGISCGLYTPNEARRNIDLPNRPGGDRLYFNGSNIPIELAGKQYVDTIAEEVGEKAVKCLEKAAESAIMELKSWVTIDGNHVFIDDGSGGGSGGGSSGGSEGSGESGGGTQSDSSGDFHPVTDAAIEAVPKIAEFGSDEVNQAVHTACKDILTAVKDDPPGTEATVSISLDLTRKSAVQKSEPGAGTVKPVVLDVPYISIHNHASGETFSDRDIRKFVADKNAIAICVVGNNGRVYILQKTDSFNWIKFGIKTHSIDDDSNYNLQVTQGAEKYGLQYYEK